MKRYSAIFTIALCIFFISDKASALSWSCNSCGQTFNFPSSDSAYMNSFAQRHISACGSSSYGGSRGGSGDPVFDAMMPLLDTFFQQIGEGIAKSLFGDPEAEKKKAQIDQWRREEAERKQAQLDQWRREEAARLAENERLRRIEEKRIRKEKHQKLMGELILLDTIGDLELLGMNDNKNEIGLLGMDWDGSKKEKLGLIGMKDDGLKPGGTSLFGLGGGKGRQEQTRLVHNDPMVVDLRDLRAGAYLAQKAQSAGPADEEFLMNEAMNVIDRKPSYIGIDPNATPVISEEGLKRFRESNKQYHLARDSHLKNADQLAAAENSFRKAAFTYEKARESMMKVMKRENVNLEELRATMTKAFNRLRELDFARQKTRLDVDIAGVAVAWTNSLRRFSLKSLTNPDPATQKFPEILEHEKKHNKLSYGEQKEFKRLLPKRRAWAIAHDKILFLDYQRISNPALQARVENLVSRVRALSPIPDHPKHVQIIGQPRTPHPVDIDGKEREIYTLGDTIYFGIEYFDHKPSDDEIMFIAGHEMAHMYLNHSQLTMVAKMEDLDNPVPIFTEPYDYKSLGSPTLSKMEQNWIRNNARKARMQEFNQEKEFSSDRFGFHLALGAGARPNGIREAMDWIRNENKRSLTQLAKARAFGGKGIPNAELKTMKQTATHAEPDERLKRLRDIYGSVIDMVPSKP